MEMNKLHIDAEPFTVEVELDHTALIVIDMQKDFLYPGVGKINGLAD